MRERKFIVHTHKLMGLGGMSVDLDFAAVARVRRQRTALIETRGPQPFIDPDSVFC
jgi:hypothetical protein